MYVGIDLGTSGLKAVILSENGEVVATAAEPLPISRPKPLWSEQDPADWAAAMHKAMHALKRGHDLSAVKAVGLTGQMHGAVLLDKAHTVLRPAILWNDGRSFKECAELEALVPRSRAITGNLMMPGFTAPKLKWVQTHEPDVFARVDKVLLPKDYLRLLMTGDFASDMSDAAGTMWLDVGRRNWSDELLAACDLSRAHMPTLFEGNAVTGRLTPEVAADWGMNRVPVVAGGGDNAAGAVGVGLCSAGQAMLSLGTSGVYFVVSDGFRANPERAVHSFCHALPETWHLMSVMLSAAACLDWACRLTRTADVATLIAEVENGAEPATPLFFLPYLSGERTPHNNPDAKGTLHGFTHEHGPEDVARAVLEGVGFGLADGMDALHATGLKPHSITLIGGGARSRFWRQMLADITGETLDYRSGGETGPALGAAQLARLSAHPGVWPDELIPQPPLVETHRPNPERHRLYRERLATFRALYRHLSQLE
ncbi:MAG: xylulokinase [Methylobacteriaceae bacterium]|jgi:xylulokinase|nr:xylulokinase [Methylobacteriaceae bacterium]